MSSLNAKIILQKAKIGLGVRTDTDLSALLGVAQSTIATWKKRNTLDYSLIIAKCIDNQVDLNWLFSGEPAEIGSLSTWQGARKSGSTPPVRDAEDETGAMKQMMAELQAQMAELKGRLDQMEQKKN